MHTYLYIYFVIQIRVFMKCSFPKPSGNKSVSPNNFFPRYLFLIKVTVGSLSLYIRPFLIDVKSKLLIASLAMFLREFFHEKISVGYYGFLSGILLQNRSMPLTVFFRLWKFFIIAFDSSLLSEIYLFSSLNSIYI